MVTKSLRRPRLKPGTYNWRVVPWAPLAILALVCGLVQVTAGVVLYLLGVYFEPWSLRLMMVLQAAYIVVGNRWYGTHVLRGQTTYWKALIVGIVISVGVGLVYAIYNLVSVSFVYAHFLEDMVQAQFASESVGMDPARAAQLLESLRAGVTLSGLAIANLIGAARFGTMLSLLISLGFLRRWRLARPAMREGA